MAWLNLFLALALPTLLGGLCVALLIPAHTPGRLWSVCGYGMLLGMLMTASLVRVLAWTGAPPTYAATMPVMIALTVLAAVAHWRGHLRPPAVRGATYVSGQISSAARLLLGLLLLLLALRLLSLGLELLWRPLYPWDATMHWATKAKVWFEAGELLPFVEHPQWLAKGVAGVYTDFHPGYPITTPLLQLWVSSALGRWDESLINLPWLLCYVGLGAAFYGQSRAAGAQPLVAVTFSYLLMSMPVLNVHVALAGYADLFLGACYVAAIMAFHNWVLTKSCGQGLLAVIFALCCPLIKNEGLYWLLTFIPGLIVVYLPLRKALLLLAAGALLLGLVLVLLPADLVIAGHSLQDLNLEYRPAALGSIGTSLMVQDNWHLLGYLLLALAGVAIVTRRVLPRAHHSAVAIMLTAIALFLLLFLTTKYAGGAVRFTAVNRIALHLTPGLMYLALLLYLEVASAAGRRERQPAPR